ncbi:MAG TPA: DUF309 domain-containing protein [Terracidiphilus sp.]|nr:DUF309 domain-containing protein [Terracidiphilus sp.]
METRGDATTWTLLRNHGAEGLRCYEGGRYFEAHEHWESLWLEKRDPVKSFLQSLIKIAAAMHHLRRGNRVGALSHLRKVQARLAEIPAEFYGVKVSALRGDIERCIAEIEHGTAEADVPAPRICTLGATTRASG